MITCALTKNYGGIKICGSEDDLCFLYESIAAFMNHDFSDDKNEEIMTDIVYGFLYDLCHAYEGQRDIHTEELSLPDDFFECHNSNVKITHSLYYEFIYSVPDFIYTLLLFNYFNSKNYPKDDVDNSFCVEDNYVKTFFSIAITSLKSVLTKKKFAEVKKILSNSLIEPKNFINPLYETVIIDYLNSSKTERQKKLFDMIITLGSIEEDIKNDKLKTLVNKLYEEAKSHDCSINDFNCDYPEKIIW